MCKTISLSKLINSVTISYTFLLRQKRYKENPTILCQVCLANIERKHIYSHIIKVHSNVTYCRLPIDVEFICTCGRSFTLAVLLEFIKHVWYCGLGNTDQQFKHFDKILQSAPTSEEYLTLQNALATADDNSSVLVSASSRKKPVSLPAPDEKYSQLVQSVHKIMEQVPLLKNLDKDQLNKIILYSEQFVTTDLLNEYLYTSQRIVLTSDLKYRLKYFFETLENKDVCSFCKNLKGCPMLHYNTHLPSSSNTVSSLQLCGKCNKVSILLTLSDFSKFLFHVINCVSDDKEKINSFCLEMERLFVKNDLAIPDYKSSFVQFSAAIVKLSGVYKLTEELRYLLTPESFTKVSPLDIMRTSSLKSISAESDCILNCIKCDKDFSSRHITKYATSLDDDNHFFSTQDFVSNFSNLRPWFTNGLNFELFKGISGLKTYMLLSLHYISSKRFIFTHSFIFRSVCRSVLMYCLNDPDICILPNSCLCRDTIQYDLSKVDTSNTHRHCIIVFRSDTIYSKFKKYYSNFMVGKEVRKCYTKKIDTTMHLAKTFYYCSYEKTQKKPANRKRSYFRAQNDIDDCMGNIHFAFTSPVSYHFKPLIYICYKTGLEDWINEEYTQSESNLLNFFENIYVNTDSATTFVPIKKAAPILCRYIKDHPIDIDTFTFSEEKQKLISYLKSVDCPLVTLFDTSSEIKLFNVDKLVIPVSRHLYGQFKKLLNISSVDIRRNVKRTKLIHELLEVNNYQSALIKALIRENCELKKNINE